MNSVKLLSIIVLMLISAGNSAAQDGKVVEFRIEGLSCGACANSAQNALIKMKDVDSARVDFDSKKAVVYASDNISEEEIKTVINDMNFEALFGAEQLISPLSEEERKKLDIKTIKGGNAINFSKHLAKGKLTIFDFYADWCGPCRVYSPKLENLLLEQKGIALRKVDLVDWKSDLAKQLTKDYQLPALPFTLIFDDKGKLIGKVEGNDIEAVKSVIQ